MVVVDERVHTSGLRRTYCGRRILQYLRVCGHTLNPFASGRTRPATARPRCHAVVAVRGAAAPTSTCPGSSRRGRWCRTRSNTRWQRVHRVWLRRNHCERWLLQYVRVATVADANPRGWVIGIPRNRDDRDRHDRCSSVAHHLPEGHLG